MTISSEMYLLPLHPQGSTLHFFNDGLHAIFMVQEFSIVECIHFSMLFFHKLSSHAYDHTSGI